MSIAPRMNRLFAPDGKCFDVAVDHGFFGERTLLNGIENMQTVIQMLVEALPDAIQLSVGQAPMLQNIATRRKSALVLRTDVSNVYAETAPDYVYCRMITEPIEQAIRLDAAGVVAHLLAVPNRPALYEQCIANICQLKPLCQRFGMPLMIEPLVMKTDPTTGGYVMDGNVDKILPIVRQAVELGADIIKADPTDEVTHYHEVIEVAAGRPVLVRGGSKVSDEEILLRTFNLMQQGARGIVYGRNVIQHYNPTGMTRALMGIVHNNQTPDDAIRYLQ